MIKTILVPICGSDTDSVVFETALAVGRPCGAHLEFFHARVDAGQAIRYSPHASFARGQGVRNAFHVLKQEAESRYEAGKQHFQQFCKRHNIKVIEIPNRSEAISASWHEEPSDEEEPFITRARVHDLTVMARPTRPNGLPPDLLQLVVFRSGRPTLIAAGKTPRDLLGTVMICWKHSPEPARAVTAAMPLLRQAKHVVITSIEEGAASASDVGAVARQLVWHGIRAKAQTIKAGGQPINTLLSSAAKDCGASLLVMGGYGTGLLRQTIFGGCTQSVLEHADVPVFLLH